MPGMTVRTKTDAIRASRKNTLEFLLSEHRVACTTCDKDGDCLLQDYAYEYQAPETRFPVGHDAAGPSRTTPPATRASSTIPRNACAASGA